MLKSPSFLSRHRICLTTLSSFSQSLQHRAKRKLQKPWPKKSRRAMSVANLVTLLDHCLRLRRQGLPQRCRLWVNSILQVPARTIRSAGADQVRLLYIRLLHNPPRTPTCRKGPVLGRSKLEMPTRYVNSPFELHHLRQSRGVDLTFYNVQGTDHLCSVLNLRTSANLLLMRL